MTAYLRAHLGASLFRNTYLLVVMRILGSGLGLLFWVLAARTMPTEQVGLASGAIAASMLLAGLAQLGLGYGLVRHLPQAKNPAGLLNLALVLCGLAACVLAVVYLLGLPLWSPALLPLRANLWVSGGFVLLVVSTTLCILLNWVFLATRRVQFNLIRLTGQALLSITILWILEPFMVGYVAVITANTIAWILIGAVSLWPMLTLAQPGYRFSFTFDTSLRASFAKYAGVNFLADQFQRAPDTVLPLIVLQQFGPIVGAQFYIVWSMGRGLAAFPNSIADSFFAEGAAALGKAVANAWRSVKMGLFLAGGLVLGTLLFGRWVLLLYGPAYLAQGLALLYFVVLAAVPGVLLSVVVTMLRLEDRLRAVFFTMLSSVSAGMLCGIALMQMGPTGVGIGWLIGQILVLFGVSGWWLWLRRRNVAR